METLELLAVALGLAALCGINLYLTVFVTGLAVRFDWIALSQTYQPLEVLGHPVIIVVAGTLYFVEFFADKIPWVDSAWDTIHTVIRPIGAALLAVQVLGDSHPVFDVVVALLAGGTALSTHAVKACGRLVINGSPEPASNVVASLGEDATVLGGLALLSWSPIVALAIFILILAVIWSFAPRVFRAARVRAWLVWRKLNLPAREREVSELPDHLPAGLKAALKQVNPTNSDVDWAVRCVSGKGKSFPPNLFGYLVASRPSGGEVHFLARQTGRDRAYAVALEGYEVSSDSGFMSHAVILHDPDGKKPRQTFLFHRGQGREAVEVADRLRSMAGQERRAPLVMETVGAESSES